MTELVAPFVPVRGSWTFLPDMKRYVDDTLEVVKRRTVDKLTEFLNNLDDSGSIKFTYEVETEGQLPFLDLLLKRTNSVRVKVVGLQETYPH